MDIDVKGQPMFLTMKQFKKVFVDWSHDTIARRVRDEDLPAVRDNRGQYLFPTKEVAAWFKRRQVNKAG